VTGYHALLIIHVLLLVAWLGVDVGVFYSSFVMRRPGLTTDARIQLRGVMITLDLAPRVSLILMVPVGLGLAYVTRLGFSAYDRGTVELVLWIVALLAVVWTFLTVWAFRRRKEEATTTDTAFGRADVAGRVVLAAAMLTLGVWSVAGSGPLVPAWLAWKALIFGLIVAAGLWIRVAASRYRPALAALLEAGESPERLATVNRTIRGVYPAVLAVWSGLVVMVVLSVVRPR
jgi:hypothetical protein